MRLSAIVAVVIVTVLCEVFVVVRGQKDYYRLYGISRSATDQEIKKAFRRLALKYHPDKNKEADATERFMEITEAQEILSNKWRRMRYDRSLDEKVWNDVNNLLLQLVDWFEQSSRKVYSWYNGVTLCFRRFRSNWLTPAGRQIQGWYNGVTGFFQRPGSMLDAHFNRADEESKSSDKQAGSSWFSVPGQEKNTGSFNHPEPEDITENAKAEPELHTQEQSDNDKGFRFTTTGSSQEDLDWNGTAKVVSEKAAEKTAKDWKPSGHDADLSADQKLHQSYEERKTRKDFEKVILDWVQKMMLSVGEKVKSSFEKMFDARFGQSWFENVVKYFSDILDKINNFYA